MRAELDPEELMCSLNRRTAPRIERRMAVTIGPAGPAAAAETLDASATGVLLESGHDVPAGARITLAVEVGDVLHLVHGHVVRNRAGNEVGRHVLAIELDSPALWRYSLEAA